MIVKDGEETSLIIKDYLGSSRVVDQDNTTKDEGYYPYGTDVQNNNISTDRQFTGHRKLEETGVYHAGARFYSPQLGQFIQADKVEGPNRYMYVGGNPVSYNDPTGNEGCWGAGVKDSLFDGVCDFFSSDEAPEKFMNQDGHQSVGELTALFDSLSGGIGSMATAISDKFITEGSGSKSLSSAYGSITASSAIGLFFLDALTPDPSIMRKPLSAFSNLGKAMNGGNAGVHAVSNASVVKLFFAESHPAELKNEVKMLQQYGGGLLPSVYAGVTDDTGKLIGFEMERIHGTDMVHYFQRPAIPQDVVDRAVDQFRELSKKGFWHGDIAERNILIEVGEDGIPNNLRLIDPSKTAKRYGKKTDEVDFFRYIIENSNSIWQGN